MCDEDIDGDGIKNPEDNCDLVPNKDQKKSKSNTQVRKSPDRRSSDKIVISREERPASLTGMETER